MYIKRGNYCAVLKSNPEDPVKYRAITTRNFKSVEDSLLVFVPNAKMLKGNILQGTNMAPVIQFSDVQIPREL